MSTRALFLLAGVVLATPALGAVYSETANGDISGNRLVPTVFTLQDGSNTLTATTGNGDSDLEYLTIEVPALGKLEDLTLLAYDGGSVSFIGVQSGSTFTVSPAANPGDLLGYAHFGGPAPREILGDMGQAFGAIGFPLPLQSGKYTFWIQELGSPVTYQLDFKVHVVPEPSTWAMLGLGLLGLFALRRTPR